MVSPAASLPSPTLSSSSSHQRPPTFSSLPPPQRSDFPSAPIHPSNRYAEASYPHQPDFYGPNQQRYEYDESPHTPQHSSHNPYAPQPVAQTFDPRTAAYLPPVSSSPPPSVPQYVPPPQHQLPPDPIHSGVYAAGPGPGGGWGWRPPSHDRVPPTQGPPFGQPQPQYPPYRGPPLPNGGGPAQASGAIGQRPGSAADGGMSSGGSRGGRRRDRDDDRGEGGDEEVISTIFVVGFPDDMLEREFQNLFTFAHGFEAATLKFPSGSRTRDPSAALLAELTHLAALRESSRSRDITEEQEQQLAQHQQGLEEALAALQIAGGHPGTSSTSTSTTPSNAVSLTPAAQSGPTLGGGMGHPPRRQTIGFARFRTRADALAAREQLQGRKIDHLTGATLKAEMAKKNLHFKRTTSGEELVGLLLRSGRLAGLVGGVGGRDGSRSRDGRGGEAAYGQAAPSAREAWESWSVPPPHGSTPTPGREPGEDYQQRAFPSDSSHPQPHPYSLPSSQPAVSAGTPMGPNSYPPSSNPNSFQPQYQYQQVDPTSNNTYQSHRPPANLSSGRSAASPPPSALMLQRTSVSTTTSTSGPTDSKSLLALAEEADELEMEMEWSALHAGRDDTPRRAAGYAGLGFGGEPGQGYGLGRGMGPTSPTGTSEALSEMGRSMGNPADQNPPINTLYIGNLPAVSPPTYPPNFLEESLRNLFSRMPGFKRMSFRQKINGPMCFVEFEDVGFATLAIKEVYGHNLVSSNLYFQGQADPQNGLVKGGIRLSYSKNSLGQRGQSHHPGTNPMYGGLAHTVALAGMSTPSGSNSNSGSAQSFSSLGLSHTHQAQQHHRDGTTLSPTAQPFTVPPSSSSSSTSARSRYFGSSSEPRSPGFPSLTTTAAAAPIPAGTGSNGAASPLRSPASFSPASVSWLSTGSAGSGYGGNGEGFPSSLGGVASTWGSRTSG